jgi:hypothetical protein
MGWNPPYLRSAQPVEAFFPPSDAWGPSGSMAQLHCRTGIEIVTNLVPKAPYIAVGIARILARKNQNPRRPWSLIFHQISHQLKPSTSFRRSCHHPTSSLATSDALEVPHADPKVRRGVTIAASHRETVPIVKDLRVRIPVSTASFWARKHELSCPVASGVRLRRGCRRPLRSPTLSE